VSVWLLGFTITIPLMVFAYLRSYKERWVLSVTLTILAWVFFYMLFVRLLNLPFPDGVIFTWLGIDI